MLVLEDRAARPTRSPYWTVPMDMPGFSAWDPYRRCTWATFTPPWVHRTSAGQHLVNTVANRPAEWDLGDRIACPARAANRPVYRIPSRVLDLHGPEQRED